jgi:hypothetical protein
LPTAVAIGFAGKVNDSTSLGEWGTRSVAPEWTSGVTDAALTDRLYNLEGDPGTLTLSGLVPGQAYDIELAASYGGPGTSGNDAGLYELEDATGLVAGWNGHTGGKRPFH